MPRPLCPALSSFLAATAGRNMTRRASLAVAVGVVDMMFLTVDPAYEAAHHWVDAVLWACLAFFAFEWVVRLRHAARSQRALAYTFSFRAWSTWSPPAPVPWPLSPAPPPIRPGFWPSSGH